MKAVKVEASAAVQIAEMHFIANEFMSYLKVNKVPCRTTYKSWVTVVDKFVEYFTEKFYSTITTDNLDLSESVIRAAISNSMTGMQKMALTLFVFGVKEDLKKYKDQRATRDTVKEIARGVVDYYQSALLTTYYSSRREP